MRVKNYLQVHRKLSKMVKRMLILVFFILFVRLVLVTNTERKRRYGAQIWIL